MEKQTRFFEINMKNDDDYTVDYFQMYVKYLWKKKRKWPIYILTRRTNNVLEDKAYGNSWQTF